MPEQTGTTVLVVDDDPAIVALHEAFLSDRAEVRTAGSVAEGRDRLDDGVDVALLDRDLDDGAGDELAAAARATPGRCATALVSATRPGPDVVDVQVDDYVRKPVDSDAVLELLGVLLARRSVSPPARECAALASRAVALERARPAAALRRTDQYARLRLRLARRSAALADGGRPGGPAPGELFRDAVRERALELLSATVGSAGEF